MVLFFFAAVVVVLVSLRSGKALDFVPGANWTCSGDVHSSPWNEKIFGVNLGGWLVLEPWITPSLFYQFLGKGRQEVAMDSYSFCSVLGPKEGNLQLRRHWKTWVTRDHVRRLAELGVNSLRVPVGDWMFGASYGPYVGCTEGSLVALDELLVWAAEFDLKVLLDVHAVRRSANGLDNGGITMGVKWTSTLEDVASDAVTFEHWPRRSAEWMGTFDGHTGTYDVVNWTRIDASIDVLAAIASRYASNPTVLGVEAVNEPWQFTPIDVLKEFYWRAYLRVKEIAPSWRFVMHDSFRFNKETWGGFMEGCPDIALDTHVYQAWFEPSVRANFYSNACAQKDIISELERSFGPVIIGEWSLATDNCAMWLNGFNDNLPGYPKLPCKFEKCADPYVGVDVQPEAPPSVLKPLQGPFGTGVSGPLYGLCPVDRDWGPSSPADLSYGTSPRRPSDLDAKAKTPDEDQTDDVMTNLARKKLQAFASVAHGFYFWNFRTELEDQWSYLRAVDRGWIPRNLANLQAEVAGACEDEDVHCRSKPSASLEAVLEAAKFADPEQAARLDELALDDPAALRREADVLFDHYWITHRNDKTKGDKKNSSVQIACDFDGAASLTKTPYKCLARRVEEKATRDGMAYCVGFDEDATRQFHSLHGDDLYDEADKIFDNYWAAHRYQGATCDFGGGATLVSTTNRVVVTSLEEEQQRPKASLLRLIGGGRGGRQDDKAHSPFFFLGVLASLVLVGLLVAFRPRL
mmetsp:Transcript_19787/g.63636  ORF Transcript_19787/g.63636 Transcript_19787/m.63636 type:complete len:746 (-) Transcript_19787:112-2349(-)